MERPTWVIEMENAKCLHCGDKVSKFHNHFRCMDCGAAMVSLRRGIIDRETFEQRVARKIEGLAA